ncbi:hypothetical protein F2Q69_00023020 [Brassica cretica]|uniref:Uncharacterized protein n=1 Tax=Brassica cretica TaxID=69181 RepID=A0A8S9QAI2_BRACR|nr:hypothetical protein F2Q69_00023020 [Brassica cretica]
MWTSRRERAFPMAKDMRGDSYLTKFPMVSPSLELEEPKSVIGRGGGSLQLQKPPSSHIAFGFQSKISGSKEGPPGSHETSGYKYKRQGRNTISGSKGKPYILTHPPGGGGGGSLQLQKPPSSHIAFGFQSKISGSKEGPPGSHETSGYKYKRQGRNTISGSKGKPYILTHPPGYNYDLRIHQRVSGFPNRLRAPVMIPGSIEGPPGPK